MKILYRISEGGNLKVKPDFVNDKKSMFLHFIRIFKNHDIFVFADNVNEELFHFLNSHSDPITIIRTSLGNNDSFLYVLDFALTHFNDENEIIYFAEDDYIYKKNADMMLQEGLQISDYCSLYDHPDKYINHNEGGPNPFIEKGGEWTRVMISEHSHWKLTNSCCMTFGARVKTLRLDRDIFYKHGVRDFNLFCELVQERGRLLVSCLPSYSTHGETQWLAPFVDWHSEFLQISP